jgi:hypothetical protein
MFYNDEHALTPGGAASCEDGGNDVMDYLVSVTNPSMVTIPRRA